MNLKIITLFFDWFFSRIAAKLISGILLFITLIFFISNWIIIVEEKKFLYEQIDALGEAISTTSAVSSVEALLIRDYPVLETFAELLVEENQDISFIRIEREDGQIAVEMPQGVSRNPAVLESSRIYTKRILEDAVSNHSVGKVILGLSTRRVEAVVFSRIWTLVRNMVTSALIIMLTLLVFLKKVFVLPIERLEHAVSRIGPDDLTSTLFFPGNDEISRLGKAFNQMQRRLGSSIEENNQIRHLLSNIINSMPSVLIGVDKDCIITQWNLEAEKDTGFPPGKALGQPLDKVIPRLSPEIKKIHHAIKTGHKQTEVKRPYRKAGEVFYEDVIIYPLVVNRIEGAVIRIDNVTEKVRLEERIIESEKKYRFMAENMADVLWTMDLQFDFTYISPSIFPQRGYTVEEVMGTSFKETILPDATETVLGKFTQTLERIESGDKEGFTPIGFEIKQPCKDGGFIWTSNIARVLKDSDNNPVGILGVTRDITQRKLAEEEIQKFKAISDKANYGSAILDLKGNFEYINEYFTQIHGFTPKELLGQNLAVFHNEKQAREVAAINRSLWNQRDFSVLETWHTHKDGTEFPMLMNGIILNDENGIPQYMAVTAIDISESKKLETKLQQAQKMESIGRLAGGIAHDFNNILFPVLAYVEMLLQDIPEGSQTHDRLKKIYAGAIRARDLVKQILTFSRQDSTESTLMKIQPIIKEALQLIRSAIPATIKIKQNIMGNCGRIRAHPTQILQIIMNLTTNASHSMEETGGELKVGLKEIIFDSVDLISPEMTPGVYACLSIADTGKGMDKAVTGKIFDPFFTTKKTGKGTGMGLSVVHGIVKGMNGAIQVYSEPDIGSEFKIYLPVEKDPFEDERIRHQEPIWEGSEQILLVDDEEEILAAEKQLLERLGYQVTSHISSVDALKAFRAAPHAFDLVITDMAMPNIPGDQLSTELLKTRPDIPVLLCTGFSETISEEKASALGLKGFLLKPIILRDLSKKIRDVLDEKE